MKTEKFMRLEQGILASADLTALKIILPRLAAVEKEIDEIRKTAFREGQMSGMSTGEKAEFIARGH